MTRSIVRRMTIAAPQHLLHMDGPPISTHGSALAEATKAQVQITETIMVVRKAVTDVDPTAALPGSDAELESIVFEDDMLADARQSYLRPRGHLTQRLTAQRRESRATSIDATINIRLARRPFAIVQANVRVIHKRGKALDVLIVSGPDTGRLVCAELGLAFPWDVLV